MFTYWVIDIVMKLQGNNEDKQAVYPTLKLRNSSLPVRLSAMSVRQAGRFTLAGGQGQAQNASVS